MKPKSRTVITSLELRNTDCSITADCSGFSNLGGYNTPPDSDFNVDGDVTIFDDINEKEIEYDSLTPKEQEEVVDALAEAFFNQLDCG